VTLPAALCACEPARQLLGEELHRCRLDRDRVQIDEVEPALVGDRARDLPRRQEPELDQDCSEPAAAMALRLERRLELGLADQTGHDEDGAEAQPANGGGIGRHVSMAAARKLQVRIGGFPRRPPPSERRRTTKRRAAASPAFPLWRGLPPYRCPGSEGAPAASAPVLQSPARRVSLGRLG
jgi:hypothetical protein